jgi:hypothetical protein
MMIDFTAMDADTGVKANRDCLGVYRYRVCQNGVTVRGVRYNEGDLILLSGCAAWDEAVPRSSLELADPDPVKQTADPATWEAQHASSVRVHLNESLVVTGNPCQPQAQYAGEQGIARVHIVFCCGPWFVDSFLTLTDAERVHAELGEAIETMKRRMFANRHIHEPTGAEYSDSGDLFIHQAGGTF